MTNKDTPILVTGATGQLGHDVMAELARRGLAAVGVGSRDLDITDAAAVSDFFREISPRSVIHCAAYTAVDRAEEERERCFAVNAAGTEHLARAAAAAGAKFLYISTDYVFGGSGTAPWETDAPTGPRNVYGASKLAGEIAVREALVTHFVVRISWVFGKNGNNFVKTMLRLAETRKEISVVADQYGAPTYTADLAPLLCEMIETEKYGTYHATNEGETTWAAFAEEIFRAAGVSCAVRPISTADYPTKAARPANSRLSKRSLDAAGFARLPHWEDALARYLKEIE